MLPDFLYLSYKRYKEDTSVFTTWLSQTAKACGYQPKSKPTEATTAAANPAPASTTPPAAAETINAPKGPRLKGKARKLAREAAKEKQNETLPDPPTADNPSTVRYAVTTQDILKQAEVILNSGKDLSMPRGIQRVISRAIQARERCAEWYAQTGVNNERVAEGHSHFIQVLKKVYDMLKRDGVEDTGDYDAENKPGASAKSIDGSSTAEMQNRFALLEVEDIDEITAMDISTTKAHNKKASRNSDTYTIWEPQVDSQWEIIFAIFCFFEDLHRVRDELRKTWNKYKSGDLDIISATIVTTAAFDLVRRAEEDICLAHKEMFPRGSRSYIKFAAVLFTSNVVSQGECPAGIPDKIKSDVTSSFEEFIFRPTAHILLKFWDTHVTFKDHMYWPLHPLPMRITYNVRPELRGTAITLQREEEDRMLTQLLLDILLRDGVKLDERVKEKFPSAFPPFDDAFTSIICFIWRKGEVSALCVFAARVLLDMMQTLGHHFQGMEILQKESCRIEKLLLYSEDEEMFGNNVVRVPDDECFMSILSHLFLHTSTQPPFRRLKELAFEYYKKHPTRIGNLDAIEPNPDLDWVVNYNPLYVGTVLLNLAVLLEEGGVKAVNHNFPIYAIAHLYNALRKLNLTQDTWPEMEMLIEKDVGPLFAGDIPTTPEEMYSRLRFRMKGLSYGKGKTLADRKGRWKIRSSPAAQTLREFFEKEASNVEKTLSELDEQIQQRELALGSSPPKKKRIGPRQLSPLQFLTALEGYMPFAVSQISINYLGLLRTCQRLMNYIRVALSSRKGVEYAMRQPVDDLHGEDDNNSKLVLDILKDTFKASESQVSKINDRNTPFKGGPQLLVAGEVFNRFRAKMAQGEFQ